MEKQEQKENGILNQFTEIDKKCKEVPGAEKEVREMMIETLKIIIFGLEGGVPLKEIQKNLVRLSEFPNVLERNLLTPKLKK